MPSGWSASPCAGLGLVQTSWLRSEGRILAAMGQEGACWDPGGQGLASTQGASWCLRVAPV